MNYFERDGHHGEARGASTVLTPAPVSGDEIRVALERVTGSAAFRSSPQLVAFLRYIVETTLKGEADRIKAATIGTDAFGRPSGFDSQRDPIVRVEAQRLRRALTVYYEAAGADDSILIEVPRGGYVPVFCRRVAARDEETAAVPRSRSRLFVVAMTLVGLIATFATLAMLRGSPVLAPAATGFLLSADAPVILVEPMEAASASASSLADALNRQLADALRRIQPVVVISAPAAGGQADRNPRPVAPDYRMTGMIDAPDAGAGRVTLRLVANGAIAWTRDWRIEDRGLEMIAREAAVEVAASSGIMRSRLRAQSDRLSAGYRCVIAAADYMRKYELAQHERIRDCLERTAAQDSKFEMAFGMLALVYEREYLHDLPPGPHEPPAIERSLLAAQHALALNPDSVLANIAIMENMYLRGDLPAAFAAGEKARSLNPLDPVVSGALGLRLLLSGETERGAAMLRQAASRYGNNPVWLDFGLFCLAYLQGDISAAARHADLDLNSTFPYGLASRALVVAAAGERERARQILNRLTTLYPGWSDPKTMLARFIRSPELLDLLARDLAAIARS